MELLTFSDGKAKTVWTKNTKIIVLEAFISRQKMVKYEKYLLTYFTLKLKCSVLWNSTLLNEIYKDIITINWNKSGGLLPE